MHRVFYAFFYNTGKEVWRMLKLEHISKRYREDYVLKDISCDVQLGEFFVLVGRVAVGRVRC